MRCVLGGAVEWFDGNSARAVGAAGNNLTVEPRIVTVITHVGSLSSGSGSSRSLSAAGASAEPMRCTPLPLKPMLSAPLPGSLWLASLLGRMSRRCPGMLPAPLPLMLLLGRNDAVGEDPAEEGGPAAVAKGEATPTEAAAWRMTKVLVRRLGRA